MKVDQQAAADGEHPSIRQRKKAADHVHHDRLPSSALSGEFF